MTNPIVPIVSRFVVDYMYTVCISCGALGCTLVISAGSRATNAKGLEGDGVGRIHPPQIDWNCSLADISLVPDGSWQLQIDSRLHLARSERTTLVLCVWLG